ncbi:hypothetical protein JCM10207_000198 [Rhodosporidiobolus poonsookiae]
MAAPEEDVDYYALIGVEPDATQQQIKTAYRKKSLAVHPDRNPDNPDAASLFHALNAAFTLLSSPTERAKLDAKLAAANARKARFAALDGKRKAMASELEERERAFKRSRGEQEGEKRRKDAELERLKEEGRRLREARNAQAAQAAAAAAPAAPAAAGGGAGGGEAAGAHDLGPLDKTLKVKWRRAAHPALVDAQSIEAWLASALGGGAGAGLDSVVLSSKTLAALSSAAGATEGGKKPPKTATALVAFHTLSAAVRCFKAARRDEGGRWGAVEVEWAAAEVPLAVRGDAEVVRLAKGGAQGKTGGRDRQPPPPSTAPPSFSSFSTAPPPPAFSAPSAAPSAPTDESSILAALRAREKERERLMEEMKREDEAEERAARGGA